MGSQKYRSKVCTKCGVSKPHTEFYKNKVKKDGASVYCKECVKEYEKEHKQTPVGRYSKYKAKAKAKGREFDLTFEEFDHLTQQPCTFCGSTENGHRGLDRYDNNKGYTKDNAVPCCWPCNNLKHTQDAKEFLAHVERIFLWTR